MRTIIPKFIRRRMGALTTAYNQRKILELTKSSKLIFLEPVSPGMCRGNIEHYYHFIFDLILPLNCLIKKTSPDVIFIIKDFGIYTDRLQHLFPGRIKIKNEINIPRNTKKINLIGMNPKCVHFTSGTLESFKRDICRNLDVAQDDRPNKILLIERLPPDSNLITNATSVGVGATRRSILNHEDLTSTLRSMVRSPLEFHNLQLENMTFKEQVHYFDRALIVIGQHGASLANCIWMKRESIVIELSNKPSNFFQPLCKLKKHHYFLYKTVDKHITVDTNDFANWILKDARLKNFFYHQ